MKFTVVIPLYNKERHIRRAIISVLNQTIKDLELIIVDDGSTDNSIKEAAKIEDSRIRIIKQKNSGVSAARNRGIYEAKFNYIAFLDADDEWKPDFLNTIKILINDYPNAGAYATAYEIRNGKDVFSPISKLEMFEENWKGIIDDYFKYAIKIPLIPASSVVIPKNVFNHLGGFSEKLNRGEDLEMWCRIALNYDIAFFNKICSTYYKDSDNRACNKKITITTSFSNYAEDILLKMKNSKNSSVYFEEYMIKKIINKARILIFNNNQKEARRLLCKYKYTKFNKKDLIKTYIISIIPKIMINGMYKFKSNK